MESQFVELLKYNQSDGGVVSLLSMLQFLAGTFIKVLADFNAIEARLVLENRESHLRPEASVWISTELTCMMMDATTHGLTSVESQCQRIIQLVQSKPPKCGEVRDEIHNLRTRFEDEFSSHLFLHLSHKEAEQYQNPINGNNILDKVNR